VLWDYLLQAVSFGGISDIARTFGYTGGVFFALLVVLLIAGTLRIGRDVEVLLNLYKEQIAKKDTEIEQWKARFSELQTSARTNVTLTADALRDLAGERRRRE